MSEKENQEQEPQVAIINDLPVSQAELDEVKGGPLPVLHVISNSDFYYR